VGRLYGGEWFRNYAKIHGLDSDLMNLGFGYDQYLGRDVPMGRLYGGRMVQELFKPIFWKPRKKIS
jgi:hypothetical protein